MRAKYVLSEVMVWLWRNVTMTIAMIITMAVSLTMLGASLLMYKQIDTMKAKLVGNIPVAIFLPPTAPQDQIKAVRAVVDADPRFKPNPTYVSQQDALVEFQKMH